MWSDQNSRDAEPQLEIDDIQGDIVVGLQKDFEWFIFFNIVDPAKFKDFARKSLVPRVSSAADVLQWEFALKPGKKAGQTRKLPFVGLNLGFTKPGLDKLLDKLDVGSIDDPPFNQGMARRSQLLNDPDKGEFSAGDWKVGGPNNTPDGVILIAGPTQAIVDRVKEELTGSVQANHDRTKEELTDDERVNGWKVTYAERGMTRQNNRSREHFGFQDGVSQPDIRGRIDRIFPDRKFLQPERNPSNPAETSQGSDLVWPGEFVFGYPSAADTSGGVIEPDGPGDLATGSVPWTRNGSLMVVRRLNQLVPEFNCFVEREADATETDHELFGARMVGRWKSGAPLSLTPLQDDSSLGADESRNNDFDFANDPRGRRCPFSAHIRKAYPRSTDTTYSHRLIRRGIPFGLELNPDEKKKGKTVEERGLMFVCYQTSIKAQFEFVTNRLNDHKTGPDPLLDFIRPSGGGYFFMPSITIFKTLVALGHSPNPIRTGEESTSPLKVALQFDQRDLRQVFLRLRDLFNAVNYDGMQRLLAMGITLKMLHHADSITGVGNVLQWLKDNKAFLNPQFIPDLANERTTFLEDGGAQISGPADWHARWGSDPEPIQYCFNFVNEAGRWFLINAFGTVH